ncbi:MAG: DoxX family protein [Polyangiaceae bacterium]
MNDASRRLLSEWGPLVSRACLALVFMASGFFKLAYPTETVDAVASRGIPASHALALAVGCFELGLGLLLLVGFRARWCAGVLLVFLVPVTFLFHNPAGLAAVDAQLQATMIMKNMAIAGGLVGILVHGAGPLSLDSARKSPS